MSEPEHHAPIWDRGELVDAEMLRFTIGDDALHDRRLVEHDIRGSLAHASGLVRSKLIEPRDYDAIRKGLEALLESFRRGEWTVEAADEDVHSAVERRLIEQTGDAGKRLHTGRSRNEQVAVDVRLWLREAIQEQRRRLQSLVQSCARLGERAGALQMPGYTHLRRAMPSSVADWIGAHGRAFEEDEADLVHATRRARESPLGTGAGYGVPLELDRAFVAQALGFERPQMPVTAAQHGRGRAELAYATALEAIALDLGKLAFDLWLFSASEFGFVRIPPSFTTGSSLMPQKRNPDVIELVRAHARQVASDRAALLDVIRDLPSGYHRDFQLVKPPLFRAHDRVASMLPLVSRLLDAVELDEAKLREACADPTLQATARALEKARRGMPFRDAYREESRGSDP